MVKPGFAGQQQGQYFSTNKLIQTNILITAIADIIAIITVSQLILFALFLISGKRDHGLDKTVLALFLLANGFFILNFIAFEYSGDIIPYTVNLFFIGGTFGFLFSYLFFISYTRR